MLTTNLNAVLERIPNNVTLVAVSKTKPVTLLMEAYVAGQRHFGENYVQELLEKQSQMPSDVYWHMIGHLQSNKVKYIAPFVYLIHGVDSLKLLKEINKQAQNNKRTINVLLQVHVAVEETKFGFDVEELKALFNGDDLHQLSHICVRGLMTMGSNTEEKEQIKNEFLHVSSLFQNIGSKLETGSFQNVQWDTLSMGMSGDFELAIECGSTMVRVGSLIFGSRNYIN